MGSKKGWRVEGKYRRDEVSRGRRDRSWWVIIDGLVLLFLFSSF